MLKTARLRVTTWLSQDVDDLQTVQSDPVTVRWVRNGRSETHEEVEALTRCYLTEQRERG